MATLLSETSIPRRSATRKGVFAVIVAVLVFAAVPGAFSADFIDAFVSAGGGGLDDPFGLVFGPDDNLYVSSFGTDEVLRYGTGIPTLSEWGVIVVLGLLLFAGARHIRCREGISASG